MSIAPKVDPNDQSSTVTMKLKTWVAITSERGPPSTAGVA